MSLARTACRRTRRAPIATDSRHRRRRPRRLLISLFLSLGHVCFTAVAGTAATVGVHLLAQKGRLAVAIFVVVNRWGRKQKGDDNSTTTPASLGDLFFFSFLDFCERGKEERPGACRATDSRRRRLSTAGRANARPNWGVSRDGWEKEERRKGEKKGVGRKPQARRPIPTTAARRAPPPKRMRAHPCKGAHAGPTPDRQKRACPKG